MVVKQGIPCSGFDVNQPLSASQAAAFKAAGMDLCIRYIPRTVQLIKGNLTMPELNILLDAGLSLMAVQHTPLPGWMPTAELGSQYGSYAATYAEIIGLPKGVNIWLDLEEVSTSATAHQVIDYCTQWFAAVNGAGYVSGLYVGYQTGLRDQELWDLPVKSYWKAYNCDQSIPKRGWQIIQHTQKSLNAITYDPNTIQADNLGSLPMVVSSS